MPDPIKAIILALVSTLAPYLYSVIGNIGPNNPLSSELFTTFLVWIIAGLLGGGAAQIFARYLQAKPGIAMQSSGAKTLYTAVIYFTMFIAISVTAIMAF